MCYILAFSENSSHIFWVHYLAGPTRGQFLFICSPTDKGGFATIKLDYIKFVVKSFISQCLNFFFLLIQKPKILLQRVVSARKILGYYHISYVNDVYMPYFFSIKHAMMWFEKQLHLQWYSYLLVVLNDNLVKTWFS